MVGNLPIKKFKIGNIEAAIWSNKRDIDNAEVEFKTVSLSRSFKKRDENIWRSEVLNLRRQDLVKILLVVQKAQEELFFDQRECDWNG